VELTYFADEDVAYTGRLLGLIDEKQFCVLSKKSKELAPRVATGRSVKLAELVVNDNYKDKRLVMVIRVPTVHPAPRLFISKQLKDITSIAKDAEGAEIKEINLMDSDDNWIILEK
jgi:hypothetical protein